MNKSKYIHKSIKFIIIILFIFCLITMSTANCSYAKGKFIELNFIPETGNQAILLNNNEFFFPGGWEKLNNKDMVPITAKIYKIKENKLVDLKSTMQIPRNGYYVVQLDNNNILVIGGFPYNNNHKQIVEKYNIESNKFTRVNKLETENFIIPKGVTLNDNRIFTVKGCQAQIFNPKKEEYYNVGLPHEVKTFLQFSSAGYGKEVNKNCYTNEFHLAPSLVGLKDGRVLIYDNYYSPVKNDMVELFLPTSNSFTSIPLPKDIPLYETSIVLSNGKVLFIGGFENSGKVTIFDPNTNTFSKITDLKPGFNGSQGIMLNNNKILLLGGTISSDEIFGFNNKYLEYAIYDIVRNIIEKKKIHIGWGNRYSKQIFDIGSNRILIFENKHKTKIYRY